MADMDHDSYWYRYLLARHDVFFYMGVVCVASALIFTVSGGCLVKYQGIVLRSKDPKTFWQNVAVYYALGFISIALYFYTGN